MRIFNFLKNKKPEPMSEFSKLIYNELNYITSYCINQNLDMNKCNKNVLAILSENIGMIYLSLTIVYLQHCGLIKEKNELIKDFKLYIKELYGEKVSYKKALEKVYDLTNFFNRKLDLDNEEKTIDDCRVLIRTILSRQNKSPAGEVATFFGVGILYDEGKMTEELLEHVIRTRDIIIEGYKEKDKEKPSLKEQKLQEREKEHQLFVQKLNELSRKNPQPLIDWLEAAEQIPEEGESIDEFIKRTSWTLEEENYWRKIGGLPLLKSEEEYRKLFKK